MMGMAMCREDIMDKHAKDEITRLQADNEALRARVAELEAALRPFADEAEFVPDDAIDIHLNYMMEGAEVLERAVFTAASIHKAAQLLRAEASDIARGGSDDSHDM